MAPVIRRARNHNPTMGANIREIYFVPNRWTRNYIRFSESESTRTTMIAIEIGTIEELSEGAGTAIPELAMR
jgi:hypothetical protein